MTIQYDAALCARLEAEALEDDARMDEAPWAVDPVVPPAGSTAIRATRCTCTGRRPSAGFCPACHFVADFVPEANGAGIVRMRNNLRLVAEQLEASRVEIARLKTSSRATVTSYDPKLSARLLAEAVEDDARMTPAPWTADVSSTHFGRIDGPGWPIAQVLHDMDERPLLNEDKAAHDSEDALGIARQRNNLRSMIDQLAASKVLEDCIAKTAQHLVVVERELTEARADNEQLRSECHEMVADRDVQIRQLRTEISRMQPVVASVERLAKRLVEAGHRHVTLENAAGLAVVIEPVHEPLEIG